ncbi:zinc finger protein ZXDC-like [Pecten maximus]|uniref:zinc finger protein ZXDC-like n=1 Tax=Pecten maximus TaxID=6579 RepID=UPI001459105B|nr:zinc finger protein ZXDC-like [Pecten maximus]
MSCEGGLVGQKHGGPHGIPHESRLDVNIGLDDTFRVKNEELNTIQPTEDSQIIQDGVGIDGKNVAEDNLHFLSADDDLDSYERAVVENNAEWLKSRCRNLETVDFDITSSNQDDASVGDLFDSDPLPDDGTMVLPEADSATIPLSDGELNFTRQLCEGQTSSLAVPSICVSNVSMLQTQHRDALDDLTNPNMGTEGKQLNVENLGLQLDSDRNNTLMTPQELESMPDRGIEFEESVGPKSDAIQIVHIEDGSTLKDIGNEFGKCQLTQSLTTMLDGKNKLIDTSVLNRANVETSNQSVSVVQKSGESGTSLSQQHIVAPAEAYVPSDGNLKLATISISTDKMSNSTQILVNTNQGQQLYHINTADLTQATNALEPLSRPNALQHVVTDPSQIKTPQQMDSNVVAPVQTGYLILPTSDYEKLNLQNGILMSSPLGTISGNVIQQAPQIHLQQLPDVHMGSMAGQGAPRKYYMCGERGCEKIFKKLSKFRVHQMRHTGERPFKCSKPGCEWAFTTLYKLKRHGESHQGKKDYICDFEGCDKKFTTVYNLNSHRRLHERPCVEVCTEEGCDEKFATKRQLDLHMKCHSGMEKTYKCPVEGCDKTFFSAHCMGSHPRVHTQEREDLTCKFEGCGKVFDKICRLKQHMRSHTGEKPYICRYEGCGWAFATASKLKRHQAKHTGLRKFVCQQCNKGFMRAEHLKGHMMTHSGEKPYACPVEGCTVKFTAKSSLYVHMKKHEQSEEKIIYHCPMDGCQKKYSNKVTLRQHIVKQHISANSDVSQMDFTTLLIGGFQTDEEMAEAQAAIAVSSVSNAMPNDSLESPNTILIDPSEFITSTTTVSSAEDEPGTMQQISPAVLNQLLSSVDQPTTSSDQHQESSPKIQIAMSSEAESSAGRVLQENNSGSARTDFRSNHLLSDRARKRRQLLREKVSSVGVDQSSFQDTTNEQQSNFNVPTSTMSYSSSNSMTSRGITFRDPETGVLYVQTQLLQDDPPTPDLYSEETALGSDLSSLNETSGSDISEHTLQTVEFVTGSTINLQDLE